MSISSEKGSSENQNGGKSKLEQTAKIEEDSGGPENRNNPEKKKRKAEHCGAEKSKVRRKVADEKDEIMDVEEKGAGSATENEASDREDVTEKEAIGLTGKSFRTSFNSADGLAMLRKFVAICTENERRDLAGEYLSAGGSALEILRLLETSDKKNISNATTVFSAIHIVLMKILAQYSQYHSSAEEACRHLVNSHLSSVHSMLSAQSNAKQRRVILRLLAAIVSLGGNLSRELLGHLSLHSEVLATLTKHSKPTDPQSVRTCFIHFVLAFLIEGDGPLIRAFLEKRGVLTSIFPDLIYDSHKTVHLTLTTIKTYVLENPGVSKTSKLHTFSTPVVQNLVALYNWKGPKNWPGKGHKRRTAGPGHTDPAEKEVAVEAVHEFLLTLLTSKRFGIIFHDPTLGTSGRKYNQLVNTILQSLDRPWEHEKPLDLVVKILGACPDLVRSQLVYTEAFLEPRASNKWIAVMEFIRRIVESMDPDTCLKPCLSELAAPQLFSAVTTLTAPLIVLKNAIVPSFSHSSTVVLHEAVSLLTVMLRQLEKFVKTVGENTRDEREMNFFKNSITDYILKNMPSLDSILAAWNNALSADKKPDSQSPEESVPVPTRKGHLTAILNLLLAYQNSCPQLLDTCSTSDPRLQPTTLLTGLNALPDVDEEELSDMKVKALQFLLALDSSAFVPNKKLFSEALPFLVSLLDHKSDLINFQAKTTVRTLLNASGLFEGCADHVDIWMNSALALNSSDERVEVATWLVQVVRSVAKHTNKYIDIIAAAEESAGEQALSAARTEEMFNDLMEIDRIGRGKTFARLQSSTSITPLIAGALEKLQKNPTELLLLYMSHVISQTLHCQVAPGTLIHLVSKIPDLPSLNYISSWIPSSTPSPLKKPFSSKSLTSKLSKALLSEEKMNVDEIFEIRDEEISSKANELLSAVRLSLFYLTQLAQQGKLTEQQSLNCKVAILSLLRIAEKEGTNNVETCAKLIFTNPIVLRCFSPICKRNESVDKFLTIVLLEVCEAIVDFGEKRSMAEFFQPFRDKLVTKLVSMVKKGQNDSKIKDQKIVMKFVEVLQLRIEDIVELLKALMGLTKDKLLTEDKSSLSTWGIIIPKLLGLAARCRGEIDKREQVTLDKSIIERIGVYLTQLKNVGELHLDSWETNLYEYLKRFPHNIVGIDTNLFKSLLEHKMTQSTINLVSLIVSRNPRFISVYLKHLAQNENSLRDSSAVFPIISSILSCKLESEFLKKLYNAHKSDIISCFTDPASAKPWIQENSKAVVRLIESEVDTESCAEIRETILSNGDKLDSVDAYYVELLKALFAKAVQLQSEGDSPLLDFAQVLIHIAVSTLKKDAKNTEKLTAICKILCDVVDEVKSKENDSAFLVLSQNHSWPQFTRFSMKLGLKASKKDDMFVPLLKTLHKVCDVAYKDDGDEEYVKTLFEMTTSHSEFINIMLGVSAVKRDLVELLRILVRKNNSLMLSTHVPLYLAAYNATLSETDQLILQLLQYYESCKVKLNEYRPYLWGNAAASHYSVKGGTDTALWRQPTTSQVLDLLIEETIFNTVQNFPVHRKLTSLEMYPAQGTYDPAFYLPLLCHLLSDNSVVACHKITQSGALALVLAACGSTCDQTRLAAFTAISRFYFHLEATNPKEKMLWMHFVDALRNGMASQQPALKQMRLSCLVSTFLARASLVATQPSNPLYAPLQSFLMAKPALDLNTIPELLQLFHSAEVHHRAHRHWILEVIRDGIRTEGDMEVALRCVLFRMLLDFHSSVLADKETRILILQVVNSAAKIPKAAALLVTGYALMPWLHETALSLSPHDLDSITTLIDVTHDLLDSLLMTKEKHTEACFMLLRTLLIIGTLLSKTINVRYYTKYVKTLEKLVRSKAELCGFLSRKDMTELVGLSKNFLENLDELQDLLQFGCKFAVNVENPNLGSEEEIAGKSLRKLIFTWCALKRIQ